MDRHDISNPLFVSNEAPDTTIEIDIPDIDSICIEFANNRVLLSSKGALDAFVAYASSNTNAPVNSIRIYSNDNNKYMPSLIGMYYIALYITDKTFYPHTVNSMQLHFNVMDADAREPDIAKYIMTISDAIRYIMCVFKLTVHKVEFNTHSGIIAAPDETVYKAHIKHRGHIYTSIANAIVGNIIN